MMLRFELITFRFAFAISDVQMVPETNYFCRLRHQDTSSNSIKIQHHFRTYVCYKSQQFGNPQFRKNGKNGRRKMLEICLNNSWES